jgi:hypothetical protein
MIGFDYLNRLNQLLNDAHPAGYWMDKKTSFDFIYEAAKDMAKKLKANHSSQSITTVINTILYPLNPDFMEVLTEDGFNNKIIKYSDGTNTTWLKRAAYGHILHDNNTTSVPIPGRFAVTDYALSSRITGTTTANGVHAGGESILTDSLAPFANVKPGDAVMNTTSSYIGVVLSVTSTSALVTAMFNVAATNSAYASWVNGNAYIIQPKARYALILDPPPATSGHIMTVPYICKPAPVYSDYGSYNFATGYEEALIKYAFFLYKYRDTTPNYGDALYKFYDMQVREAKNVHRGATTPKGFKVSFLKR